MATTLRVAELDFDSIKSNLREFLRSKPEFTDYDYEGAGLSVLMDLLAYNTHYNAVIANMLAQEMYLDTAVKKQSLALIAKRLGYTPKSMRASRAVVNMEVFPSGTPDTITLQKNSKFTSRINFNQSYTFVNRDAVTINRSNDGRYIFNTIELYEGDNTQFKYIVNNPVVQKFPIPSSNVDTSLVRVYVQDSISSSNVEEWKQFDSIIDVDTNTKCYFVKLNEELKYEVYFGDGVLGKQLLVGNVVIIDYVATNGPISNGASVFSFADSVSGTSNTVLTTAVAAYGGAYAESMDDVRRNAQNRVLSQNRAVTEGDYVEVISRILPIETIAVYGGETVSPPQYGKVFISAKLTGTTFPLTPEQKDAVIMELKKRSVLSLLHEFIDPEYSYIIINTEVKYDARKTTLNSFTLRTAIHNKLVAYGSAILNKFDSTFEYSKLVTYIDGADKSIISNDTSIQLRKELPFVNNFNNVYVFNFYTSLVPSNNKQTNIQSTAFRIAAYGDTDLFTVDLDGNMVAYYMLNNMRVYLDTPIGTVDYATGKITITLTTTTIGTETISITVVPANKNILPSRNNILTLRESDINIRLTT